MGTKKITHAFVCPSCGGAFDNVFDTRHVGNTIRRKRNCMKGHVVITTETVDTSGILPSSVGQ